MMGIEPRTTILVEPGLQVRFSLYRPLQLRLCEKRILGDNYASDRIDVISINRFEHRPDSCRQQTTNRVRSYLGCQRHRRRIENEAAIVLHIDDERVDLGAFRHFDEPGKALPECGPSIDVQAAK